MDVLALAREQEAYVIEMRRWLHQHPELSWQEWGTTAFIEAELQKMGLEPHRFDEKHPGLWCMIEGGQAGPGAKTILLRADIDALPVTEDTGLPYASENPGVMHACGHDTHGAMLLGATKILVGMKDQLKGNVKVFFQAGEETSFGAKWYVEEGIMDGVDACYGCHIGSWLDAPFISVDEGARTAACDEFKITIDGVACHGGMPYVGRDAITAASAIVMNLQQIVSRRTDSLDALVITVGTMHGGTAYNIVCGQMVLTGTVRSYSRDVRAGVPDKIREVAENTAKAFGCTATVEYMNQTPSVINDNDQLNRIAKDAVLKLFGPEKLGKCRAIGGGDDFGYFMEKAPGMFPFIGAGSVELDCKWGHHHPKFKIDESVMYQGTAMFVQFTVDYLEETAAK